MKIGIIGAGSIGGTIARKLSAAGHEVKLANSKGADAIRQLATELGARGVSKEDAVRDVDAIILSIPFGAYADLGGLFADVPLGTIVADTSNYYPFRDGVISEVVDGKPESVWISEQIGRPVIKAWNAVLSFTLADRGKPRGAPDRIALPVAGDDAGAKARVMELVEATGFDALDAGGLAESWRQQPGAPAYCTELSLTELKAALAAADKALAPKRRDALMKEFFAGGEDLTHEKILAMNRSLSV